MSAGFICCSGPWSISPPFPLYCRCSSNKELTIYFSNVSISSVLYLQGGFTTWLQAWIAMRYGLLFFQSDQLERHGTAAAKLLGCLAGAPSLASLVLLLGLYSLFTSYRGISGHLGLFHSPLWGVLLYFERHSKNCNLFQIADTFLSMALLSCNVHGLGLSYINELMLVPTAHSLHQGWKVTVTSCSPCCCRLLYACKKDNPNCSSIQSFIFLYYKMQSCTSVPAWNMDLHLSAV